MKHASPIAAENRCELSNSIKTSSKKVIRGSQAYPDLDMKTRRRPAFARPSLALVLFACILFVLWIAGGSSRADAMGQAVTRFAAWGALIAVLLAGARPRFDRDRAVWILLAAIVAVPLIQLIPLPPSIWQALPGRALLHEAVATTGQAGSWRPIALVPGATLNAASSLVVPLVVLILMGGMKEGEQAWPLGIVLLVIALSMLAGLAQFSGIEVNDRLVNYEAGTTSGTFANRNHFALLLALGCAIAPVWAFLKNDRLSWRVAAAAGLLPLFALVILASGSRAGTALGGLAILFAPLLVWGQLRRAVRGLPRWVLPAVLGVGACIIAVLVLISVGADRAASIDRAATLDVGDDMRSRGLPVVLDMIRTYFPFGTGMGGFDPLFRIHEPFELLKRTYFNNAHNDFLEIALAAGIAGIALMAAALVWWGIASFRAWKAPVSPEVLLARLGSLLLLLVLGASVVDYPARTPLVMAVVTIAAVWLGRGGQSMRRG